MLDHIGESPAARRIEAALVSVLAVPEQTTPDLGGKSSTTQFTHAIVQALHEPKRA
jgi:isocitrate/isopropylmalate dehydrogenase